nr:hypothetical protein [uncultured Flavobacterium sp.]
MPYYNTTYQTGQSLIEFSEKADKQDALVYDVFRFNPEKEFTPFNVQYELAKIGKQYPITSIRRSINTLTKDGKLKKLERLVLGDYDRPNHTWKFNKD